MLRGLYTAAAGMMTNMIATDVLANNIANTTTVGFKKSDVTFQAFDDMLISRINAKGAKPIGKISMGSAVSSTPVDFSQGTLKQTGNPLDMAIEGDGFFTVKNGKGELFYTRDGNFTIDKDGFLTTHEGCRLQQEIKGEKKDIQVPEGKIITVTPHGELDADNTPFGTLLITRFENNKALEKMGNTLYKETPGSKKMPKIEDPNKLGYKVHQNSLEYANSNIVEDLVKTMTGFRLYEALQKNIQMQNDTLGRAVNDVGKSV